MHQYHFKLWTLVTGTVCKYLPPIFNSFIKIQALGTFCEALIQWEHNFKKFNVSDLYNKDFQIQFNIVQHLQMRHFIIKTK